MGETSAKKDKEKKKAQAKREKAQKMRERKENNNKGKSLEDMMAYIDENGNISDTPPDPNKKVEINAADVSLNVTRPQEDTAPRKGSISFFNEAKGYGFITDMKTRENIFVHANNLSEPVKERDQVQFEVERGPKGLSAVRVRKLSK